MKAYGAASSLVIAMLAMVSCTAAVDDDPLDNENVERLNDEGATGHLSQPLLKGRPGGVNGAVDYCNNPGSLCSAGEGDCDSNAQCMAGLICAADNGPKFGFPAGWDVCVAAHCANKVQDGDETGLDCGGSCGACSSCVGAPGGANFCNGCQCASGQGDCDNNAECASGLVCGVDNGPSFGLPMSYDVCVPPHCTNGVQDAASGETGIDDGGPCGARATTCSGTPGSVNFCVGCLCASGEGDCDGDAECASGLKCGKNNGPRFSLPAAYDVCVPAHCTNLVLDAASGETSVDAGGPCGAGAAVCGNGAIESGEVCDDGVNDGVLCSPDCQAAALVAEIRGDCDSGSQVVANVGGSACNSFGGVGASFLTFDVGSVSATIYAGPNCTGNSVTVSGDTNFCNTSFDQGGGLNDNVQSVMLHHL